MNINYIIFNWSCRTAWNILLAIGCLHVHITVAERLLLFLGLSEMTVIIVAVAIVIVGVLVAVIFFRSVMRF